MNNLLITVILVNVFFLCVNERKLPLHEKKFISHV